MTRLKAPGAMTPPVDRPTPVDPPEPHITAPQAIELIERIIEPVRQQVRDMHSLMMGVKMPDGTVKGGIGKAVHDVNNSAVILTDATRIIEDSFLDEVSSSPEVPHKSLPDRIAASVASKFIALYQTEVVSLRAMIKEELKSLIEADHSLLERVTKLEELAAIVKGPNGGAPVG